jgi:hypothetical protein
MSDEKAISVAPDTLPAQPNPITNNSEHALSRKIARLPHDIRNQLNQRLLDDQSASITLPWLNGLPAVQKILAAHFDAKPVNAPNLTHWRQTGFQRWLKKQEPLAIIQELSEDAADFFRAGRGRIASGAATIASSHVLEFLRSIPPEKRSTADLAKIISSISTLIKIEQASGRLKLAEKRVLQRDEQLLLTRDRDQRNVATIGLRLLADARAKQIEASSRSHGQKLELLGRYLFGNLWRPRSTPQARDEGASTLSASETAKITTD